MFHNKYEYHSMHAPRLVGERFNTNKDAGNIISERYTLGVIRAILVIHFLAQIIFLVLKKLSYFKLVLKSPQK